MDRIAIGRKALFELKTPQMEKKISHGEVSDVSVEIDSAEPERTHSATDRGL
jgi:hypothetical protein